MLRYKDLPKDTCKTVQDTSFSFLKSVLGFSRQNRRGLYLFLSLILKKFSLRNWLTGLWRPPDTFTVCRADTQFQSEGPRAWSPCPVRKPEGRRIHFHLAEGWPAHLPADWMRPVHTGGPVGSVQFLALSVNSLRKHHQTHPESCWTKCLGTLSPLQLVT